MMPIFFGVQFELQFDSSSSLSGALFLLQPELWARTLDLPVNGFHVQFEQKLEEGSHPGRLFLLHARMLLVFGHGTLILGSRGILCHG